MEMKKEVLERIELLENQLTSLQEEVRKTEDIKKRIDEKTEKEISTSNSLSSITSSEEHNSVIIDEDIGEVNANARKPRNLRISNTSLLTQRIYADDDFKVYFPTLLTNIFRTKSLQFNIYIFLCIFLVNKN